MANAFTVSDLNPLGSVDLGLGGKWNIIIAIFIAVVILILLGVLVWWLIERKKWKIKIPVYQKIGNVPTRIAILKAKIVPFGRAGDCLWYAKGKGMKKWLPPATLQSAPNEYPHYIREDLEWINFVMEDLDESQKRAGVKYIATDMKLSRLATDQLLEQRHIKTGFLEKWGVVIGYVIFFLIITIALVVFFHQYSKTVEILNEVMSKADAILEKAAKSSGGSGLLPALILFSIKKRKNQKWVQSSAT